MKKSVRKEIAKAGVDAVAAITSVVGGKMQDDGMDTLNIENTVQAQRLSELELMLHLKVDIAYIFEK